MKAAFLPSPAPRRAESSNVSPRPQRPQRRGFTLVELLSIYHDQRMAKFPDVPSTGNPIPNWERRGNVVFCDGHAEFVSRKVAHDRRSVLPMEQ